MKILNIDIETSPAKAYIWDLRTNYVPPGNLIEPKRVLCFAAKWVGEDRVFFYSTWHDGRAKVVRRLHELLDEADAALHYNGQRFDRPVINTEFVLADMLPPSPTKDIDLYRTVKRQFAFMSNKLDYVSRQLGTETKVANEGMPLWLKVMKGDAAAQVAMRRYNIGDVHANESLFELLRPWLVGMPSLALEADAFVCPTCGSADLQRRGFAHTLTRSYRRYQCQACGRWSRDTRSIGSTLVTPVAA